MKKVISGFLLTVVLAAFSLPFAGCAGGGGLIPFKRSETEQITVVYLPFNFSEVITGAEEIKLYYNGINGADYTEHKNKFESFKWVPTVEIPTDMTFQLSFKPKSGETQIVHYAHNGKLYASKNNSTYVAFAPEELVNSLNGLFSPFFSRVIKDTVTELKITKRQIVGGNNQEIVYVKTDISGIKDYLLSVELGDYSKTDYAVNKMPNGTYNFDYTYEIKNNTDLAVLFYASNSGFYFKLSGMQNFVKILCTVDLSHFENN